LLEGPDEDGLILALLNRASGVTSKTLKLALDNLHNPEKVFEIFLLAQSSDDEIREYLGADLSGQTEQG
jgi:hypothetical protein